MVAPLQQISRNGYLYVFVSNESEQNVYFDDLTLTHTTGPLQQEQSFYPYGLQMAGLSDKAALRPTNPYKYNAGSLLEDEDGIDYYNTFYRKYDAQIGRFTGIDILAEDISWITPYQFGANNPAAINDPFGDWLSQGFGRMEKGPDRQFHVGWVSELMWKQEGFSESEIGEGGGGGIDQMTNAKGFTVGFIKNQMRFGEIYMQSKSGEFGLVIPGHWINSIIAGDGGVDLPGVHHVSAEWRSIDTYNAALDFITGGSLSRQSNALEVYKREGMNSYLYTQISIAHYEELTGSGNASITMRGLSGGSGGKNRASAAKGGAEGGLNLFKFGSKEATSSAGWKSGDRFLKMFDQGSPKLNWKQNSGFLRSEMNLGKPIFDSYRLPNGNLIPTGGFLNAERSLLQSRGWLYNSGQGAWLPPIR